MPKGVPKGKRKLTDEERKANAKAYRDRPEIKARKKALMQRPENIAKAKERQKSTKVKAYQKAYRDRPENKSRKKELAQRPEVKAYAKDYSQRPDVKARKKELAQRPETKARRKVQRNTPEAKAKRKAYFERPDIRAKGKEYRTSPEVKARKKKIRDKPENKAKEKKERDSFRLNVLKHYSKRLSNSEIPCCRCCGQNSHLDFLTVDHIAGKKQMDFEPELVKLGYSSKKQGKQLDKWLIENDFPKGFQILCHSCNMTKAFPTNNNKCPMQNEPH